MKNPNDPSCQQQQSHTAAYMQALNSGSPNPYKPGTKDYEHYQAGLIARQQNSGAAAEILTPNGNVNNNNPPLTKKCPDGSTIPIKDKCPEQTNPSSLSAGSSTPSSPSGSLSPPSGGSNSGGSGDGSGSSDSGSGTGGGSRGSSSSSGDSSSSGSSSNSDSGSHHHH